jgi:hypothetical protein
MVFHVTLARKADDDLECGLQEAGICTLKRAGPMISGFLITHPTLQDRPPLPHPTRPTPLPLKKYFDYCQRTAGGLKQALPTTLPTSIAAPAWSTPDLKAFVGESYSTGRTWQRPRRLLDHRSTSAPPTVHTIEVTDCGERSSGFTGFSSTAVFPMMSMRWS